MAHRHREHTCTTVGYRGTARGADENRAAHGGVCHIERCRCGALREVNSNGGHLERGTWYRDDRSDEYARENA